MKLSSVGSSSCTSTGGDRMRGSEGGIGPISSHVGTRLGGHASCHWVTPDGARGCLGPACRRSCPGRRLPSHPSTLGHTQGSRHMPSRSAGCALTHCPLARPRPLPAQPGRMAESGNGSRPSFGSAPSTCRTRSTRSSCYRRREYLTRKQTESEKSRNRGE